MRSALLLLSAAACSSGSIDPAATDIRLELDGDSSGLVLRGSPVDPAYVGTYSNPRELSGMRVDVMADGQLRTSCQGGDCSDPPFVTRITPVVGGRNIEVWDIDGVKIAETLATPTSCEDGLDDVCDGDGDGDGDDGGDDGGGGGDCDSYDDVSTCGDCPALRSLVKERYCAIVNQALAANQIDHTYDCADLDDELDFSSPPPDVEPGCNDIVEDPADGVEDDLEDSECPELEIDLVNWQMNARGDLWAAGVCGSSPLILDLDGDGIRLGTPAAGVPFDILGTGEPVMTAWPEGGDAFLVLDADRDGAVDGASELFGNATGGRFHQHGFAALAELDDNGDGAIDRGDRSWRRLRLWSDGDRDGRSSAPELARPAERGVTRLELAHEARRATRDAGGSSIPLVGSFRRADGTAGLMVDAYLAYDRQPVSLGEPGAPVLDVRRARDGAVRDTLDRARGALQVLEEAGVHLVVGIARQDALRHGGGGAPGGDLAARRHP
jgi:hypothetical protein